MPLNSAAFFPVSIPYIINIRSPFPARAGMVYCMGIGCLPPGNGSASSFASCSPIRKNSRLRYLYFNSLAIHGAVGRSHLRYFLFFSYRLTPFEPRAQPAFFFIQKAAPEKFLRGFSSSLIPVPFVCFSRRSGRYRTVSAPSCTSTVIVDSGARSPSIIRRAISVSTRDWISRFSGRAP